MALFWCKKDNVSSQIKPGLSFIVITYEKVDYATFYPGVICVILASDDSIIKQPQLYFSGNLNKKLSVCIKMELNSFLFSSGTLLHSKPVEVLPLQLLANDGHETITFESYLIAVWKGAGDFLPDFAGG